LNAQVDSTAPLIQEGEASHVRTGSSYEDSYSLVVALQNPALYEHPVDSFQVIETHISWVLLTGPFAYKIKKPVRFSFLDFSSLSLRKQYCEEELRLNRRFAPQLYEAVIPVTGSIERPRLGGKGQVIEYLVKMRQFSQQDLLSHLAESDSLLSGHVDEMAAVIAGHHRQAKPASENMVYGTVKSISNWVNENFTQVWPLLKDRDLIDHFVELQDWSGDELEKVWRYVGVRKRDGFVRECHGDLHLGNMVLIDNHVTLFDCIEFNPELRWIDVISEVAFVVMDLQHRGHPELAWRFINHYLQQTGDYAGLKLLR
jgi:aminoglycoside phosphotransferase family enzyme